MENSVNDEKSSKTNLSQQTIMSHKGITDLFSNLIQGIVLYSHKIFRLDDNAHLDEYKKFSEEKYAQIQSEVSELKERKSENIQQKKEYNKKSKLLNLLEVQAKLAQIKQNKKKFSKFWKRHA